MVNNSTGGTAGGSTPTPPPPPPPPPRSSSAGTKRPITPVKPKETKTVCPVCKRNLYHEKALNGHIRWHTVEEREAIARALASTVVVEEQEAAKRVKIPDLNRSPPPEYGEV